jgi:acyl carrier protein
MARSQHSSWTEESIARKIEDILVDHLGVDESEVTPQVDIRNDLSCDSLDDVEIIMACEEEFNIEILDDDAATVRTPQQLVDLVLRVLRVAKKPSTLPLT